MRGYTNGVPPVTNNAQTVASQATDSSPFIVGDKVTWTNYQSYRRRIGVVTQVRYTAMVLTVVDFQTGETHLVPYEKASVIHGYMHIDTPQQERF